MVFASGQHTKLGNIVRLTTDTKRTTQYEKSLAEFSGFLIKTIFVTLLLVFVAKLIINVNFSHPEPAAFLAGNQDVSTASSGLRHYSCRNGRYNLLKTNPKTVFLYSFIGKNARFNTDYDAGLLYLFGHYQGLVL